jgi:hypothetical protein
MGTLATAQIMAVAEAFGHVDQQAANLPRRLSDAEKELAKLQERFAQRGGYYLANEVEQAEQLVKKLREAREAQDDLKAERGTSQSQQFGQASAAIDALAKKGLDQQREAQEALTAIRAKAMGVDASYTAQLQKLHGYLVAGALSQDEYVEGVKNLIQLTVKKTAAHKQEAAAMDDAVKAFHDLTKAGRDWARGIEATNAGLQKEVDLGRQLTEAEKQHLELTTKLASGQLAMSAATEKATRAAIDHGEALRGQVSWQRQSADENARSFERLEDETAALEQRAEAMRRANDTAGQTPAALREIEAAEYRAAAAAKERLAVTLELVDPLIAAKYRQQAAALREMGAQAARTANIEAARASTDAWQKMADDAGKALTDAIFDGGKNAGEMLQGYFKSMVLRPIVQAYVQPLANTALQVLGVATGNGATAGGSTYMQAAGLANSIYNAYQGGGIAGAAASAGNYAAVASGSAYGTGFGTQQSMMLAAQESGMVSSAGASSMAAWAGYAAAVIAAYMGSRSAWEAGYNNENLEGAFRYSPESTFTDLLKIGGMSDRSANIWGGGAVYTKLFGRAAPKVMDTGVMGTLRGGDFTGLSFADIQENGGWFRSDKNYTETKAVASSVDMFFDDAAAAILKKAGEYGKALGLPAEQLANISTDIKVSLGDDAEKNRQAIVEALAKYGDALAASFADQVAPLQQYGESVSATLQRVGGAIAGVNQVLEAMGHTGLQASIAGGKAAADLDRLFGGVQNLSTAAGSFVGKFYSQAEQLDLQAEAVAAAMGKIGLVMPDTREQFRQMVDGIVEGGALMTEAGRQQFAVLMGVADAFDVVASAAEEAQAKLAQEAAQRAATAQQLIDQGIGKFLSADDLQRYRYGRIAQDLGAAGQSFSAEQLMSASKADVFAFVSAVVNLKDGASEAELTLLAAAGALADLKDEAASAAKTVADAAAEAAAQRAGALADALKAAQDEALAGVVAAYQQVQQQVDGERSRIQAETEQAIRAAEQQADAGIRALETKASQVERIFGSMLDGFDDALRRVAGQLAGDDGRGQALRTLRGGLAALQGGGQVDADALRAAAGQASQVDAAGFKSRLDYQRELASTANLLRDLSGATRGRLTSELGAIAAQQVALEKSLADQTKTLKDASAGQLSRLDEQLRTARGQAETLVRIDDGVSSVAGALAQLAQAISATRALQGQGSAVTNAWQQSGGTEVWQSKGGAVGTRPAGSTDLGELVIKGKQSTFTAGEARTFVNAALIDGREADIVMKAIAEGIDSASLDALMNWPAGTALREAQKRGLPAFATGSSYVPSTGPALIHEGERIIPAADNRMLMQMMSESSGSGRDELVAEIRELRRVVEAAAEFQVDALPVIARNTRKTEQALDAMVFGRVSIPVKVVAD